MPIYEYVCMSCESHFEELVRSRRDPGRAPTAASDEGEAAVLGLRGSRHQQAAAASAAPRRRAAAAVAGAVAAAAIDALSAPQPSSPRCATRSSGCTRCPLSATRTQVVFGVGLADADLMFVGEAPGFHEDKQGVPFVGAAGQLLGKLLAGIGLTRDDVFVANVLKCRPPGNRDPQPEEIAACESHLFRQIELIQPKVVATLGNFATKLLSGKPDGITRVHGREQEVVLGGSRVLLYPIFHPAAALYTPRMLDVLEADFQRLPELLGREPCRPARPPAGAAAARARPRDRPSSASSSSGSLPTAASPVPRLSCEDASSWPSPSREETEALGAGCALAAPSRATSSASPASSARARRRSSAAPAARSASTAPVTSPTFTIGHRYEGRVPVAHLDLYRLDGLGAEGLGRPRAVLRWHDCFVEWPEHAGAWLPPVRAAVTLEHVDEIAPQDQDRE